MGLLETARDILAVDISPAQKKIPEIHRFLYLMETYIVFLPFVLNFVQKAQIDPIVKEECKKSGLIKMVSSTMKQTAGIFTSAKSFVDGLHSKSTEESEKKRSTALLEELSENLDDIIQFMLTSIKILPQNQFVYPTGYKGREGVVKDILREIEKGKDDSASQVIYLQGGDGNGKTALACHLASLLRTSYPEEAMYISFQNSVTDPSDAMAYHDTIAHTVYRRFPQLPNVNNYKEHLEMIRDTFVWMLDDAKRRVVIFDDVMTDEQLQMILADRKDNYCLIITSSQKLVISQNSNITVSIRLKEFMDEDAKHLLSSIVPAIAKETSVPPKSSSNSGLTLSQKAMAITCKSPLGIRILGSALSQLPEGQVSPVLSEWYAFASNDNSFSLNFSLSKSVSLLPSTLRQQAVLFTVFPFHFDAAAAASVVDGSHDVITDALETLVTKGILDRECTSNRLYNRYVMPPAVKEYMSGFLSKEMKMEATKKFLKHYKRVIVTSSFLSLQGGEAGKIGLELFHTEVSNIELALSGMVSLREIGMSVDLLETRELLNARIKPTILYAWHNFVVQTNTKSGTEETQFDVAESTIECAKAKHRLGMINAVHRILKEALELSQRIRYGQGLLETNLYFANIDCNAESFDYLKTSLSLCKQIPNARKHEAQAYLITGKIGLNQNSTTGVIESFKKSLSIYEELNMLPEQIDVLFLMGRFHEKFGQYVQAVDMYVRALKLVYTTESTYREPTLARRIGRMHMLNGEYEKAVDYLELGMARGRISPEEDLEVTEELALCNSKAGNKVNAIIYYSKLREHYTDNRQRTKAAEAANRVGMELSSLGKKSKALELFKEALQIAVEERLLELQGTFQHNLGSLYKDMKQFDRAVFSLEQSIDIATKTKDEGKKIVRLNALGTCFMESGNFEKAKQCFQRTQEAVAQLKSPPRRLIIIVDLNSQLLNLKLASNAEQYERVVEAMKKISRAAEELKDTTVQCEAQYHTATALHRWQTVEHREEILSLLNSVDQNATLLGRLPLKMKTHRMLGEVFEQAKRWGEAEEEYNRALIIAKEIDQEAAAGLQQSMERVKAVEK
ncbi:Tetratricopeptide TPR_2 repeat protein [Planoprotostelium fungivorum]|uniref:Tetratricopeptide TPR_2 repeat protein n=1 Tax=Planoprotostelium fungivorum TaxID=1890364 RepID=A0A2P6N993_9EUKA|nr:Tetratricopeptide TPR_2 repeat protein [Planoprotostelium fungivorum]